MKYDGHGRQSRWIFPSKTTPGVADQADYEQYSYDPAGNRTSLRKRDGSVLGFQYDALNRVVLKSVPASASGAPGYSVHYGFDNRGLQTHARFGSSSGPGVTNAYDGFGRLKTSTTSMDGVARALVSTYDSMGNRTVLQGDSGYFARFDHDGLGRMTAHRGQAWIGYDSAGRRSSLGIGPGGPTSSTAYSWDGVGRLSGLTHDLAGTASDQSLGFGYNPASQIVRETRSNDSYAWTGAVAVSRPYSVNGQNQYVSAGAATFAYDANGNLISDGTTSFVYDAENRLVSASGAKTASLAYDPLGRLWQVSGAPGSAVTRFLYDGDRLVMEYGGSGNVLRSYVHGPGTDEPLVWYEGTAGWAHRYLYPDSRGSIVAIADINGLPVAINTYDEYGIPGANNQGRFQYTDARGFKAEMAYDGHGRQSRWVFPSKTTPGVADQNDFEQYGYDPNGNRTSLRKRDGQVIGFDHDALNRVTLKTVPTFGMNVRYSYDLRGLQTRAWFTGNDWGISNAWDGFGRLVSTTSNMGGPARTISHRFDREGRRIELAFPDGNKFWTARDGLGRAIDDYQGPHGSTAHIMTAFAYNPAGQRSYFARRFGDMTSYGYDAAGRLNLQYDGGFAGGTGRPASPPDFAAPGEAGISFGRNADRRGALFPGGNAPPPASKRLALSCASGSSRSR
jgi:YD repeat-containing protein